MSWEPDESDAYFPPSHWEDARNTWGRFIDEFERELYYPVMSRKGINKSTAFLIYEIVNLRKAVEDLRLYIEKIENSNLEDEDDDGIGI